MADDDTGPASPTESPALRIREPPKVLVPVEVLEGQSVSTQLVEFLAPAEVVLLGYHVLPEQTPTEQASMQFEDRARGAVDDIAEAFREAGREVETRVVFTHDRDATVDRVAAEADVTAVLLPNPVADVADVLVPIRGAIDAGRLADLVATLLADSRGAVTLWGIDTGGEFDAAAAVDRARGTLLDRGLAADRVRTEVSESDAPARAVIERSPEFDVIVMGESGPDLLSLLLGDPAERVAEGAVAPVLVVRERSG
ncbi:universal stress protein [Halolamina litorea]|uniref:Universal stress protein n=1 Tax=Halolamina litorea TaxID=1515593 RepID=A0ABD6BLV2_9EURY|nr:universal stress protein [Halolamina litorea]